MYDCHLLTTVLEIFQSVICMHIHDAVLQCKGNQFNYCGILITEHAFQCQNLKGWNTIRCKQCLHRPLLLKVTNPKHVYSPSVLVPTRPYVLGSSTEELFG